MGVLKQLNDKIDEIKNYDPYASELDNRDYDAEQTQRGIEILNQYVIPSILSQQSSKSKQNNDKVKTIGSRV